MSSFSQIIVIILLVILSLSIVNIFKYKRPATKFTAISYNTNHWLLHKLNGDNLSYDKMRICFDTGLFMLLMLKNDKSQQKLVIFNDQLTIFQQRSISILGKIISPL